MPEVAERVLIIALPKKKHVVRRLLEAGYEQGATYVDHPHRHRYYFFDHDGNEYEFVQYLSDIPEERNEY